jgi:hypothetical protein
MTTEIAVDVLRTAGGFLAVAGRLEPLAIDRERPTIDIYRRVQRTGGFGMAVVARFIDHAKEITVLVTHRRELLSGSRDGTIKVWSLDRMELQDSLPPAGAEISAVTALHIGEWSERAILFFGHSDGVVRAWDLTGKCALWEIEIRSAVAAPAMGAVSPGGELRLPGDRGETVSRGTVLNLWHCLEEPAIPRMAPGQPSRLSRLRFPSACGGGCGSVSCRFSR